MMVAKGMEKVAINKHNAQISYAEVLNKQIFKIKFQLTIRAVNYNNLSW
jgi:hypothetical protein